jgi:hypothetical protein
MNNKVRRWRKDGKHYPPDFRDFHDQKDLFKLIHIVTNVKSHEYCGDISWVKGQCYVIDIFLWCMARYGYTLQKSRSKLEFEDIQEAINAMKKNDAENFAKILTQPSTLKRREG